MSRLSTFTTRALSAQFLKPTLVLLATLAVGGVWAAQHDWQGVSGTQLYWEDSASWSNPSETTVTEWIINVQGAKVGFRTNYADNYVAGDTAPLVVLSGNTTPVEFTADDNSDIYGLTKNGPLDVSAWWQGNGTGSLKVNSGTYSFTEINVGRWNGLNGELAVVGGTVIANNIYVGLNESGNTANGTITVSGNGELKMGGLWGQSTGSVTINGGKITATKDNEWFINGEITFTVGANGGTIDTNGKSVTIIPAIAGSGTLRIVGGGSVIFSTAPTCSVVADADTTVTGVTANSTVDVSITDAVTGSETSIEDVGLKAVTASWSVYNNGGSNYKKTINNRESYIAAIDAVDSSSIVSGIFSTGGSGNFSFSDKDVYTIVRSGSPSLVIGGADADRRSITTGSIFTQIESGTTVTHVYGAGFRAARASGAASKVTGNVSVVVKDGAKVTGSVIGGWCSRNVGATVEGNTYVRIEGLQDSNEVTFGDKRSTGYQYYIAGGGAGYNEDNNGQAYLNGDSHVIVSLPDSASGNFVKAVVGGVLQTRDNGSSQSQTMDGDTYIEISAPNTVEFKGPIVGGGYGIRMNSTVNGNANITINGGKYSNTIYAGGTGVYGTFRVTGTSTITLNGGEFACKFDTSSAERKVLKIEDDIDLSRCTLGDFDTIAVAKGKSVTISSSQASLFTAQGLSVEENDGVYTARYVPKYFWTGTGDNKNWSNAANWIVGDTYETAVVAESAPTAIDPVTISAADSIVIDTADCVAAQITIDAAVTFIGNTLTVGGVVGAGAITLGDGAGFSVAANMTIANNIVVTANSSAPAIITTSASGVGCTISGALSGTGHIKFTGVDSVNHKLTSSGNSGFTGTIELENQTGKFIDDTRYVCANATWIMDSVSLSNDNFTGNGSNANKSDSSKPVYHFGKLTGSLTENYYTYRYPVIYSVGSVCGEGEEFALTYTVFSSSGQRFRRPFIQKVGAGTLKLTGNSVGKYIMAEGVLEMVNNDIPSVESSGNSTWATSCDSWRSLVFKGGTLKLSSAVTSDPSRQFGFTDGTTAILDDGGENRTFATAIGYAATDTDSTVVSSANFTKKGTGTLTLSQPPAYTGTTTVEAGTLVIAGAFNTSFTAIAPGATLKVLTPSGTTPTVSVDGSYIVATATEGDYTVYTVAESIPVNGAPANIVVAVKDFESVGITSGTTDKSAALEATAANGLAVWQNYVMNIEGNATQKFAAVVTPTTDATMTVATSFGSVAGRTGAGVTVTYKLMKKSGETWVQVGDASTTPSFSVNPSTLDANARLKIQAVFE